MVIPYLFANVVFHFDFLMNNLSPYHPIFKIPLFTSHIELFQKFKRDGMVLTGVIECPDTKIRATGIPGLFIFLFSILLYHN